MKPKQKYRMLTKPFTPIKGDQYKAKYGGPWRRMALEGFTDPRVDAECLTMYYYRRPVKSKGVKIIAVNDEKKGKV